MRSERGQFLLSASARSPEKAVVERILVRREELEYKMKSPPAHGRYLSMSRIFIERASTGHLPRFGREGVISTLFADDWQPYIHLECQEKR